MVNNFNTRITFNLNNVLNTGLMACLKDPFTTYQVTSGTLSGITTSTFLVGNQYYLYIKFIGDDATTPEPWRLVYRGNQLNGIESGYEPKEHIFEVKTSCYFKACSEIQLLDIRRVS